MVSPAESHDHCNQEELIPGLQCDMIKGFLTCRPDKCGVGDRFRCDCHVHHAGLVQINFGDQ